MGTNNQVSIQFTADTAGFVDGTKVVRRSLDDIGAGAAGAQSPVERLQSAMSGVSGGMRDAETASGRLAESLGGLAGLVRLASEAFAAWKIGEFVKDSTALAARYETLGVVMQVVGNNAGYTGAQMDAYSKALQKSGISMVESRQTLIQMTQAHIDLAKSTQLARIAQDAAVIGGINSSEAFQRLVYGIQSGQIEILRTIGINVNFENSYKKLAEQLGKTSNELTENEKTQARLNVVMSRGQDISGTYEAAMGTTGKQLTSLKRYADDLKVSFGELFTPALSVIVEEITHSLKGMGDWFKGNKATISDWSENFKVAVVSIAAEVTRLSMLLDKAGGTMTSAGMLLYGPGRAMGNANSTKQFEKLADANIMYERRYQEGEARLQALADKLNAPSRNPNNGEQARIAAGNARRQAEAASSKKSGADDTGEYNRFAEAYNRMIDAIAEGNPTITAEQKAIQKLKDQYENLYINFPKHRAELEALYQDHLRQVTALQTMKQAVAETSTAFQAMFQEWENTPAEHGVSGAFNLVNEEILKLVDSLNGTDKLGEFESNLRKMEAALSEAATAAPDKVDAIKAAIDKLKTNYADSSGLTALQKSNSDLKIGLIDDQFKRQQSILDRDYAAKKKYYEDELKLASNSVEKKAELENALALEKENHEKATKKNSVDSYKSQLSNIANYAGAGANLFSALAQAQDQSSRKGFESAKAFSLAAAIMNTAQAVMVALASPGNIYSNMAMAAVAAAMGAIQVAQIAKTQYGGGGGVVAPSGSFGGSYSGGTAALSASQVGGSIGSQFSSVYDQQTQESLQRLAASADNASLAISKVADGLTKISDLFSDGSYLSLASGSLSTEGYSVNNTALKTLMSTIKSTSTYLINPLQPFFDLANGKLFSNMSAIISSVTKSLFGGSWETQGAGLALEIKSGMVSAWDYLYQKKDGGLFGSDKERFQYTTDSVWTDILQKTVNNITSTIAHAAVAMGTSADTGSADVAFTRIGTAGRSQEDINKDLQAWLEKTSNELAKTVQGLKDYTFYNENAFDALVRLSTALQTVNEGLELIKARLVDANLAGANSAYKLEQLMGGAEKFTDAISTYFKAMYSDDEQSAFKAAQASRQVSVAFAEMGVAVPATRAAFRDLVNGLDVSTDRGASMFAALMNVAEAFGTVQDQAEKMQKSLTDLIDSSMQTAIKALTASLDASSSALNSALSIAKSATSLLISLKGTNTSPESNYLSLKSAFTTAVSSGDYATVLQLASEYAAASKTYNASGGQFQTDYAQIQQALSGLTGMKDTSDLSLDALNRHTTYLEQISTTISDQSNLMSVNNLQLSDLNVLMAKYIDDKNALAAANQSAYDSKYNLASGSLSALKGADSVTSLAGVINSMVSGKTYNAFGFDASTVTLAQSVANGTGSLSDLNNVITAKIYDYFSDYIKTGVTTKDTTVTTPSTLISAANQAAQAAAFQNSLDIWTGKANTLLAAYTAANANYTDKYTTWYNATHELGQYARYVRPDYKDEDWATILATFKTQMDAAYAQSSGALTAYQAMLATRPQPPTGIDWSAIPGFAVGTPYVANDMLANIHQGEIIIDRRSADVLRHYGVPVAGSADTRELLAEIKALREEVAELRKHSEANVKVNQSGHGQTIELLTRQADASETLAKKARLVATSP